VINISTRWKVTGKFSRENIGEFRKYRLGFWIGGGSRRGIDLSVGGGEYNTLGFIVTYDPLNLLDGT